MVKTEPTLNFNGIVALIIIIEIRPLNELFREKHERCSKSAFNIPSC